MLLAKPRFPFIPLPRWPTMARCCWLMPIHRDLPSTGKRSARQTASSPSLDSEVNEILAGLPIPVLRTAIRNRTEYAKAVREGKTALETDPSGAAASDISALAQEIRALREKETRHAAIG